MLDAGFHRGRSSLATAEKHYQAAGRIAANDPRLPYAYGLILLKHLKYGEALDAFAQALRFDETPYLPAWQATIWQLMRSKKHEAALERVAELANQLERPDLDWLDDQRRLDCAAWMGRVVGALQGPVERHRHFQNGNKD